MKSPGDGITAAPLVAGGFVILLDQITKWLIRMKFVRGDSLSLLGDYIRLTHVQNAGGAFGLFRDTGVPFAFLSVVAVIVLFFVVGKMPLRAKAPRIALGFVLGGAVGNLIDRALLGRVVDFIDVGLADNLRWPVFNIADMAVVIGIGLFFLVSRKSGDSVDQESPTERGDEEPARSSGGGGRTA